MTLEESDFDDFLLPDDDAMQELEMFEDDDMLFADAADTPSRGAFSDSPERAALWMENASRHYVRS